MPAKGAVYLRLPEILRELQWTQTRLAQETGLSQNAVSVLVRRPQRVNLDTLALLCEATGKTLDDLLEYRPAAKGTAS